jgi:hypothetical protein
LPCEEGSFSDVENRAAERANQTQGLRMTTNTRIKPIERATKRTWEEWLQFMDGIGAQKLDHHQIATRVLEALDGKIDNPAWWAQAVTVAYEQDSGRRIPGQRPDGTFQTSASKSTTLGMEELMEKWAAFATDDQEVRELISGEVRVSGTEKRITWRARAKDGSAVVVISEPKARGTASIVAQQMGLQTHELNLEAKATWQGILGRFLENHGT